MLPLPLIISNQSPKFQQISFPPTLASILLSFTLSGMAIKIVYGGWLYASEIGVERQYCWWELGCRQWVGSFLQFAFLLLQMGSNITVIIIIKRNKMSRYPGQYNNQWQQPGYNQWQQPNYNQGYVQPGFHQPGYQQPHQGGFMNNLIHRNRDRGNSSSSSSSHGSPSRRANKQRRRQMRQAFIPQGGWMGQQPSHQGGFINDIRNKVDNVIHGQNRRY